MAIVNPSNLFKFAARHGNKIIASQIKVESPLCDKMASIPMSGKVGIINIITPMQEGVSFLGDNESLPDGGTRTPIQGQVKPFALAGKLEVGDITLASLNGKEDSADYIVGELEAMGQTMGKKKGQSLFSTSGKICGISSVTTGFAGGSGRATVVVDFPAGLTPGQSVELYSDGYGGATRAFLVRVARVTISQTDAAATVVLANDVQGASSLAHNANADIDAEILGSALADLYVRGSWTNVGVNAEPAARNVRPVSLADLAGTGAVYDMTAQDMLDADFAGHSFNIGAVPTHENLSTPLAMVQAKTGSYPTLLVGSQITATALAFGVATAGGQVGAWNPTGGVGSGIRRNVSGKLDKYGIDGANIQVYVNGVPFLVDNNCSPNKAYAMNLDNFKFGVWKEMGPKKQSGSSSFVSSTKLGEHLIFSEIYNIHCNKRNTIVEFTGLTSDLIG
jgi:hypothetical protein